MRTGGRRDSGQEGCATMCSDSLAHHAEGTSEGQSMEGPSRRRPNGGKCATMSEASGRTPTRRLKSEIGYNSMPELGSAPDSTEGSRGTGCTPELAGTVSVGKSENAFIPDFFEDDSSGHRSAIGTGECQTYDAESSEGFHQLDVKRVISNNPAFASETERLSLKKGQQNSTGSEPFTDSSDKVGMTSSSAIGTQECQTNNTQI